MASFVRIDDGVIRSLLMSKELYSDFPKFSSLKQELDKLSSSKGCKCRRSANPGAAVVARTKAYIQSLPIEKKAKLKQHLKADYIQMMVAENNGRHKDYTW